MDRRTATAEERIHYRPSLFLSGGIEKGKVVVGAGINAAQALGVQFHRGTPPAVVVVAVGSRETSKSARLIEIVFFFSLKPSLLVNLHVKFHMNFM